MARGIYILADDVVLDYFVALSNSISLNWVNHPSVCVIPYSPDFGRIGQECFRRGFMVMDDALWRKWRGIGLHLYDHPAVRKQLSNKGKSLEYRAGVFNRLAAFDGHAPFEHFVYLDADIIVNDSLDFILDGLEENDIVAHDFQWEDCGHVTLDEDFIDHEAFCSGMFAAKRGLLNPGEEKYARGLLRERHQSLYAFAPCNTLLNHLADCLGWKVANLGARKGAPRDSQTYRKFDPRGSLLFDRGKRIPYFHNIGVPPKAVRKACEGKRDIHFRRHLSYVMRYRFARAPDRNPWRRGVYIVGNDVVMENVKALVNSIRYYDESVEVCLIPYDDNYSAVLEHVESNGGFLFPDGGVLSDVRGLSDAAYKGTDWNHIRDKRNRLVNLACWFGPFDDFAYMDADIVVFRPMSDLLSYLDIRGADFVSYDRTYEKNGLRWIFSEEVRKEIPGQRLVKIFNSGFWMSRKGLFVFEDLKRMVEEIGVHPEYCDYESGVVVQPVINWVVLSLVEKIDNLCMSRGFPEPWAGIRGMKEEGNGLVDRNGKKLDFLHWAGKPVEEKFYSSVWRFYRSMSD